MKTVIISLMLLLFGVEISAQQPANQSQKTHLIEIFLLETPLLSEQRISGQIEVDRLKLKKEPILCDPDFVSWDLQKHYFVIKPEAAKRIAVHCYQKIVPYVLVCEGRRIYAGLFNTSLSSASAAMPVILTDSIIWDLFEDSENLPTTFWRQLAFDSQTREKALDGITNKIKNVRLEIGPGYPGLMPGNADIRPDKRIAAAVQKLTRTKAE